MAVPAPALASLLLLALAALAAEAFEWPPVAAAKKKPQLVAAGKRVASYIACEVCEVRLADLLSSLLPDENDVDAASTLFDEGAWSESLGETKTACSGEALVRALKAQGLEVATHPNGSAALVEQGGDGHPLREDAAGESFHWPTFGVQHACTEIFRGKSGDAVATAVKDAFQAASSDEEEPLQARLRSAAAQGCRRARACVAQRLEEELAALTAARDARRAERDSAFAPTENDFAATRAVAYDELINYYKVLGVDELAPLAEIDANHAELTDMKTTEKKLAEEFARMGVITAGHQRTHASVASDAASVLSELDIARKLLADQATRRQYDRDRDRLSLMGSKRKPDKPCFDGARAFRESPYSRRKGPASEL